jgi:hypothetical protein
MMQRLDGNVFILTGEEIEIITKAKQDKPVRWKPKKHDRYCFISITGAIDSRHWDDGPIDDYMFDTGNYFRTEFDAFAVVKLLEEIQDFADANNEPIDWTDTKKIKYIINLDSRDGKITSDDSQIIQCPGVTYFSSDKLVEKAIELFGDRLKKHVLGVSE